MPMSDFLEQIQQGRVLISDGATGTYLQQHGLEAGGCPEVLRGVIWRKLEVGLQKRQASGFLTPYGYRLALISL